MKKQILLHKGGKFQEKGSGLFAKDVFHEGAFYHSLTGAIVNFSPERVEKHRTNLTKYLAAGNQVPMRDGHKNSVLAKIGNWPGPVVRHGKDLVVVAQPTNEKALEGFRNGSIDGVSVVIQYDHTDSFGNHYDEVITAIDCTDFPVVPSDKKFIELSQDADGSTIDLYLSTEVQALSAGGSDVLKTHDHLRKELEARMGEHKAAHKLHGADHENTKKAAGKVQDAALRLRRQAEVVHSHTMNATGGPTYYSTHTEGNSPEGKRMEEAMKKQMALALGLPEDAPEDKVLEAFTKKLEAGTKLEALSAVLPQLEAHGLKLDGGKVVKLAQEPAAAGDDFKVLPTDSADVKSLKEKLSAERKSNEAFRASSRLSFAQNAQAEAEKAVKEGKVPPALKVTLSRLLAVEGKQRALLLSTDGKTTFEEQLDIVNEALALVKGLPKITTEHLAAAGGDEEKKADELSAKKVDEIAERTQPGVTKK